MERLFVMGYHCNYNYYKENKYYDTPKPTPKATGWVESITAKLVCHVCFPFDE